MQFLLIAYQTACIAAASGVTVSVAVDPAQIPFHRQCVYTIVVEAPVAAAIETPELDAGFFGMPVDGAVESDVQPLEPDRKRATYRYRLDPVRPQVYAIPPVTVTVDGDPYQGTAVDLTARDLTPEEEKRVQSFAPIVQPADKTQPYWQYVLWGTAALAALALAAALWWRMRRKADRDAVIQTPWGKALDRLQTIESQVTQRAISEGPFCVALSDTIRLYLEERFAIKAPERTTPELLIEAAQAGVLTDEQRLTLERVLRQSDRVKFAQYHLPTAEMTTHLSAVRRLVEETIPVIEMAESDSEAA